MAQARLEADDREVLIEKRRSPRTPFNIRVHYSTVDALFADFSRNINEGGMFIETSEPCSIDTVVSLAFELPGDTAPIHTQGRVVWVSDDGMGIEFEELDAAARARINHLVRELRTQR
jgi:uncharacterized protein (TIGR02266 family)